MKPEQQTLEADLTLPAFVYGENVGRWALVVDEHIAPPQALFWIAAAARSNSPDRRYVLFDYAGYRASRLSGWFWNLEESKPATVNELPKMRSGTRGAQIIRITWSYPESTHFYHPYDRYAIQKHANWINDYPDCAWDGTKTIVDYLQLIHRLLNSDDYLGSQ